MEKPLRRHRQFEKNFGKRIAKDARRMAQFEERLALFLSGVRGTPLNDHALTGKLVGYRAFSITSDVRVVYVETARAFVFMDIGTHNQVYGQ
jgi:addiction module RelE/StbE family toxin